MTTKVAIVSEQDAELQRRMQRLGVREEDLEESFIRSRGPGGQRVNKVATCVVLRHRPTGIVVRCEQERSQTRNRWFARQRLLQRLEAQRLRVLREAAAQAAALRRARRRRSPAARERLLQEKRWRARKKTLRRRLRSEEG